MMYKSLNIKMREKDYDPNRDKKPGRRRRIATRTAQVAIGGSMAAVVGIVGGHTMTKGEFAPGEALSEAGYLASYALRDAAGYDSCPDLPGAAEIDQTLSGLNTLSLPGSGTEAYREAQANGLDFVNRSDYTEVLADIETGVTPGEITVTVNAFTEEQFGFPVTLAEAAGQPPIDTTAYRQDMQNFVSYTSLLPRQLLQETVITELVIAQDTSGLNTEVQAGGGFEKKTGRATIALGAIGKPRAFVHEVLGHAVHHTACEGYYDFDQAIPSLNPAGLEYTENYLASPTSSQNPDVFTADYNGASVPEDVAGISQYFMLGELTPTPQNADTPIMDKLGVILHRIDQIAPGSAAVLSEARWELRNIQSSGISDASSVLKYLPE